MWRNVMYVVLALFLSLWSEVSVAEGFRAGAAFRVVTPEKLLPVSGGVGEPNPVKEKRGDLFARALVLEKGETRVAIVGLDFLGWPSVLGDRARAKIQGVEPDYVLIGVTHTHSAPDAYAFVMPGGKLGADLEYLDWVCGQIADAVNEAVANLKPAVIKVAVGEAHGKIAYNYYAPDLYDPRCGVIQVLAKDGEKVGPVIATLVNYAIHPEILGPNSGYLSPDLCGPLYQRIEDRVGGIALFMNSAQGGMVTADCRGPDGKDIQTWDECVRIGTLLADEALRIIDDAPIQEDPQLAAGVERVRFPIDSPLLRAVMVSSPLLKQALPTEGGVPDYVETRMNILNVGTAQIVTIPGEALPNIGYYLKRNMHTQHPFLFGLTQDAFGYILTKVDFNSFKRYDYITRTSLGEMTGEILIDTVLRMVKSFPSADGYTPPNH